MHQQRQPVDARLVGLIWRAVLQHAGVRAGPADVEGQQPVQADLAAQPGRPGDPACRAGQHGGERRLGGQLDGHRAAARAHDVEAPGEAAVPQGALDLAEVLRQHGPDERVKDGGRGPLVLAVLAGHVDGQRHRHTRHRGGDDLAGPALVLGVGVGVQEAHGQGLPAAVADQADCGGGHGAGVQRGHLGAVGPDPAGDAAAEPARHDRGRRHVIEVVHGPRHHGGPGDLEHVLEACIGDQPDGRAAALQDRVQPERGSVHHGADLAQRVVQPVDGGQHALARPVRGSRRLPGPHRAVVGVEGDRVDERAADVDGHPQARPRHRRSCGCVRPGPPRPG